MIADSKFFFFFVKLGSIDLSWFIVIGHYWSWVFSHHTCIQTGHWTLFSWLYFPSLFFLFSFFSPLVISWCAGFFSHQINFSKKSRKQVLHEAALKLNERLFIFSRAHFWHNKIPCSFAAELGHSILCWTVSVVTVELVAYNKLSKPRFKKPTVRPEPVQALNIIMHRTTFSATW